ncbi:MAG: DNA polymerase III subunit beta [Oscillospiraceae bacterium]|nr:DNA polymerase III subunit beta [Oscillospiraceae bacterium]
MKFYCDKAELLNAAQIAGRAVSSKSAMPALEGLLLQLSGSDLILTGYDMKIGIRTRFEVDVESHGSIVLNSKLFIDIIRTMPTDRLTIESTDLTVKISCFASEFEITGMPASDYPDLPIVDSDDRILIPENTMKSMIAETLYAISDNTNKPIHTGSLFELDNGVLTIVSVDGFRLAMRRESIIAGNPLLESHPSEKFVVPGNMLTELKNICSDSDDFAALTVGSSYIMCKLRNTEIISRRLEGDFLDYKRSIPQEYKVTVEVDRRAITASVERVSLIITDVLKSPLRMNVSDGVAKFRTMTAIAKANDECLIKGDGGELEIGFNNRFILEALKAAPSDEITLKFNGAINPCVITSADEEDRFLYMILPVRLTA